MCTDLNVNFCDGGEPWWVNDCGREKFCNYRPSKRQMRKGTWKPHTETAVAHVTGLCIMDPKKYVIQLRDAVSKDKDTILNSIYFERCDGQFKNAMGEVMKGVKCGTDEVADGG